MTGIVCARARVCVFVCGRTCLSPHRILGNVYSSEKFLTQLIFYMRIFKSYAQ